MYKKLRTMMCNIPNLELMHTQNLVKFYLFVLNILSGKKIMMDGQNDGQPKPSIDPL